MTIEKQIDPKSAWTRKVSVAASWVSLLLVIVGLFYLAHGTYSLMVKAGDYRLRWVEEHYVFRGKNPLLYSTAAVTQSSPEGQATPLPVDPDLGSTQVCYPPWSYVTGALFTWPSLPMGRVFYGTITLLFFGLILAWGYREAEPYGVQAALLGAAAIFTTNSFCTTMITGQYGIFIIFCLLAGYLLDQRGHWFWAGLLLGMAMVKVTLAGPFILPFLVKFRWKMLLTCGLYLVLGSLLVGAMVKTSPLVMLREMSDASAQLSNEGYGLETFLAAVGLSEPTAVRLSGLLSLGAAVPLLFLARRAPYPFLFAVAALAARMWCYHRLYDNVIIIFLLSALGVTAWKQKSSTALGLFLAVGITLWIPGRLTAISMIAFLQFLTWMAGLITLIYLNRSYLDGLQLAPSGASPFRRQPNA